MIIEFKSISTRHELFDKLAPRVLGGKRESQATYMQGKVVVKAILPPHLAERNTVLFKVLRDLEKMPQFKDAKLVPDLRSRIITVGERVIARQAQNGDIKIDVGLEDE